ncbi:MAG: response regulator [Deltaproteobacteria bacterium]|jgi:putative two-component system response regulator|nr:response regulator [Deltaproteobacteria bacterium]MBT7713451.1 response regulator [Deltaproteobacteria bacterium]
MEETLLLVDDESSILNSLQRLLQDSEYRILTAETGRQALETVRQNAVDLVIADYQMPGMNGVDLLKEIRAMDPEIIRIMFSGFSDKEILADAINKGEVFRFVFKPWDDHYLLSVIEDGMDLRRRRAVSRLDFQKQLNRVSLETVMALAEAIELKDPYTKGHCSRVRDYAILTARERGLPREDFFHLVYGSLLHDCGKIGVSESILLFKGPLDGDQRRLMERHAVLGFEITSRIDTLKTASRYIRQHHERWDGNGYPDGLAGEETPVGARIIAIADTFDAMTSNRPYRNGMPKEKAMAILAENAGSQFDPDLVDIFRRVMKDRDPEEIRLQEINGNADKNAAILLVDDERSVVSAIRRSLFDKSYKILAAESGQEALKILDSEEIDLIISDQRMPEMSGVEFLSQARIRKPAAIRIMLSGYADMNAALDAINEAGIYKFLVKPWDDLELQQTIDKALEWRRMISGTYTQEML